MFREMISKEKNLPLLVFNTHDAGGEPKLLVPDAHRVAHGPDPAALLDSRSHSRWKSAGFLVKTS